MVPSPSDNYQAAMKSGTQSEADQLRRQMAQVRHELRDDVDGVVAQAKEMTEWRYYVREHPWVCVGVAAAVGFLVVPNKIRVVSPAADQLEQLAKRDRLAADPSDSQPPSKSWQSQAVTFGANMLMRAALAYAGKKLGEVIGDQAGGVSESDAP